MKRIRIIRFAIHFYRLAMSPLKMFLPGGAVDSCRYHPTCSAYAEECFLSHGFARGSWLILKRLLKCHPFAIGRYDPVPPAPRPLTKPRFRVTSMKFHG